MLNFLLYFSLILVILVLVFLTFPFRFYLRIDGYTLRLYLYNLKILEHNLIQDAQIVGSNIKNTLIENPIDVELIKKIIFQYSSYLKILYKIRIKYVKILYFGYRHDPSISPIMFAVSNALAATAGNILYYSDIPFYYNFKFNDEVKFKFSSMVYFSLGTLVEEWWRIRRQKV